jgi:hypothetical protein
VPAHDLIVARVKAGVGAVFLMSLESKLLVGAESAAGKITDGSVCLNARMAALTDCISSSASIENLSHEAKRNRRYLTG